MRILIQRSQVVGMQCPAKWAEMDFSLIQPIKNSSFNLFQLERMKLVNWIEWSFHPLNDSKPHSCTGTQFLVEKKNLWIFSFFLKKNGPPRIYERGKWSRNDSIYLAARGQAARLITGVAVSGVCCQSKVMKSLKQKTIVGYTQSQKEAEIPIIFLLLSK